MLSNTQRRMSFSTYRPSLMVNGLMNKIVIENLNLQYSDGTESLRDINLRIPANAITVLFGPAGGGKSSLLRCLNRLNDLTVLPAGMRSPQSEQVVRRLADALLDADYDFEGEHKRWLTFGVPRGWDLFSALRALAAHGYAHHPRFAPLLDLFLARQDEQGRWLCGSVSRTLRLTLRKVRLPKSSRLRKSLEFSSKTAPKRGTTHF